MKRKMAIAFLIGGLFSVTSCDEIKKAYNDTFKETSAQSELEQIYKGNTAPLVVTEKKSAEDLYNEALKLLQEKELGDALETMVNELKEAPKNFLADPERLKAIQQELQNLFPNKPLQISGSTVMIMNNMVRLDLADPDHPENVDTYIYQKVKNEYKWVKGDPVKLSLSSEKPQPLVDLSTAHKVFLLAKEKMKTIEGATIPTNVYYYLHNQKWQTTIDAARADYTLQTDTNGNLTKFEKF